MYNKLFSINYICCDLIGNMSMNKHILIDISSPKCSALVKARYVDGSFYVTSVSDSPLPVRDVISSTNNLRVDSESATGYLS